ncbi:MAG: oxidoreductase [Armatimonadota bacterium]|nr:oxidoreductase [Armatimonadota bacterium]MDR7519066.1 oxidoreductase [Armatimonadota bacterium]MDR7550221.1 oxidoreductase [Armatimonadota bacterium]
MTTARRRKPTLAVFKFASCDGCQLTLLDCEDELLTVAGEVEIAYFLEASRQTAPGPYDVALVEGSITTQEEVERLKEVRQQARLLVAIGACATAGGIQALRNWADVAEFTRVVYARPEHIHALAQSVPLSEVVPVDFELRGCPISKRHLVDLVTSLLIGRKPQVPTHSVCVECKRRGTVCVMVAHGVPCLGPATQAGCGAICPAYHRGCYGCFGPMELPNAASLGTQFLALGLSPGEVVRAFRSINGYAPAFRAAGAKFGREARTGGAREAGRE